jgi:regulator of sirC expression with transglutaminase-like and TPR domain
MDAGHVLFQHIATRPDDQIDLGAAALLIAESEYPGLDVAHYLAVLDGFADGARRAGGGGPPGTPAEALRRLNEHLFHDLGFQGNEQDYYDPKNSFLNEVIDRRIGIPITLSVLYLEVGRRAGLVLDGVSFPGHFLVQQRGPDGTLVLDPYHGGVSLSREELEERLGRALGAGTKLAAEHLQPASKRQILTRMLNNLRGIYQRSGDPARERAVLERLAILNPQDARVKEALDAMSPGGSN